MNRRVQRASVALIVAIAAGCAGMQSTFPNGPEDTAQGVVYYLPKALFKLSVGFDAAQNALVVSANEPIYVADQSHAYALNAVWGPFNEDDYKITVGANGLLSNITLNSVGVLDDAVKAAGSSFGILESGVGAKSSGLSGVYQTYIDPEALANLGPQNEAFQKVLNADIANRGGRSLKISARRLDQNSESLATSKSVPETSSKCGEGFCYRRLIPYEIVVTSGSETISTIVEAPNGSPTYAAAVRKGLTADWKTTAELTNGVLTSYAVNQGSDVVGIVGLPGKFAAGFIEGITQRGEIFTSEAGRIDAETKRIEAVTNRLQAEIALEKVRQEDLGEEITDVNETGQPTGIQLDNGEVVSPDPDAPDSNRGPANQTGSGSSGLPRSPGILFQYRFNG